MTVIFAQQSGSGGLVSLLPLLIIGVLFYMLLIRPQQKRARDQRQLVDSLHVGDTVVTIGGFHGTIRAVDEGTVRLELNPSNVVTLSKQAIARRTSGSDAASEEPDSEDVTEE